MTQYDFKSLSSLDFELLVRDLLQAELGVRFESFKPGRDRGIDLRFAASTIDPGTIVQCKHYAESGLAKLVKHIKTQERTKIDALNPRRYILATSVRLSPHAKDRLLDSLGSHCHGPQDIIGCEDLNALLLKHEHVERAHFKLWLSSTAVLESLLNAKIHNYTQMQLDSIHRNVRLYVQNASFLDAQDLLRTMHYCIICGIPGIGKTMLADMLVMSHISDGFEAIRVSGNVDEALAVFRRGRKQIFYYDDFLGTTSLGEKLGKNEDQRLVDFLRAVQESSHHRFVLTTREYILNQAKTRYERLETSRFDVHRCTISLATYTIRERARILFNHLYFSDLSRAHMQSLLESGGYKRISRHKNFSPRVVEAMTLAVRDVPREAYVSEFLRNLDDPSRLWEHPFDRQLSADAQSACISQCGFPSAARLSDAVEALESLSGLTHSSVDTAYRHALRELDGTFVQTNRVDPNSDEIFVSFQNPSVRDFLEKRLRLNGQLALRVVATARFFEQLVHIGGVLKDSPAMHGEFVQSWTRVLALKLEELFQSRSCELYATKDVSSTKTVWRPVAIDIEARLRAASALSKQYRSAALGRTLAMLCALTARRWRENGVLLGPEQLRTTLEEVPRLHHGADETAFDLVAEAKVALMANASTTPEFRSYFEVVELALPSTRDDIQMLRMRFEENLESILEFDGFSKEEALEQVDDVERVATLLALDVAERLEIARDDISMWEDDPEDPPYDDDYRRSGGVAYPDALDSELDDMFGALLDHNE